ncbi:MAG: hypothetical protein ACTSVI_17540 [Promethearchaeota archaeon]
MSSQTFGVMFKVEVDGTINQVPWDPKWFDDDNIIIVLDEYNQLVWIYYGRRNGIVTKRKAYRQADSLRGHGYTIGNSIIGRNLTGIVEIDQRKIERLPDEKDKWERLQKLFTLAHHEKVIEECVALGEYSSAPARSPAPKPEPEPTPAPEPAPKPEPTPAPAPKPEPEPTPAPAPTPKPEPTPDSIDIPEEYKGIEETFSTSEETKLQGVEYITKDDEIKAGNLIMAILRYFSDIYISKKGNHFTIESLEVGVCQFTIVDGKIKFSKDSFKELDPDMKKNIQKAFIELSA